jgi:hypothetical protein
MNDWRLLDQESYLKRATLRRSRYTCAPERDHDHCEFCGTKFSMRSEDTHEGYSTLDDYYWICVQCYNDFVKLFEWTLADEGEPRSHDAPGPS